MVQAVTYCVQHPDRPAIARGRCRSCYVTIKRMIKNGELTEKEAVRKGYLMPTDDRTKGKCRNHQDRMEFSRGLCRPCYNTMCKRIASGSITDEQAVRRGLMLKRRRTGRKREIKPFPKLSKI